MNTAKELKQQQDELSSTKLSEMLWLKPEDKKVGGQEDRLFSIK